MKRVINKIPLRKAARQKGKSVCLIFAVFLTTMLFVTVFSMLFFIADAAQEMQRANAPILADTALVVTDQEYEKIARNPRVAEIGSAVRIGTARDAIDADIQLFDFDETMAQWMHVYPAKGRMPEAVNEIVVSDQYLRDRGLTYTEQMPPSITYDIEDQAYTDTFNVSGIYQMSGQPLHVVLTSDAFYRSSCLELEKRGIAPEDATYRMAGIVFASHGNTRRLMSQLISEERLSPEEGEIFLNDSSVFDDLEPGILAALLFLLLVLLAIGYLFISNIFRICMPADARFYGRLSTNGVTNKEIRALIQRQNRMLFLTAALPALPAGYLFSRTVLPGILNGYTTLHIKQSANPMIFILSLAFSGATMRISARGSLRLAKHISPIGMKKYTGTYRKVKAADNKSCLNKFVMRHFQSDRRKVCKVCISLALSILLAGACYTVVTGFDEEEYVRRDLDADFLVAKKPIFTNPTLNLYSYERTTAEEIKPFQSLPDIEKAGGGSSSHVCLHPSDEVWDAFERIAGEGCYSTPGEMWTEVYGLDELLLEKLTCIEGTIDRELFRTGNYVLLDPILGMEDDNKKACYAPGEKVTIPFMSGEEKTYTVMAVVESLPDSLSLPGRWFASNLYLPREEWQRRERRDDYYLYAFDVEKRSHELWNDTLARETGNAGSGLAYRSAKTAAAQARSYTNGLKLAGFFLSMILLSMGILNFINCTAGSIYSRRKELAVLQSMGLTKRGLCKLLVREGTLYMAGGLVPGILLSVPLVRFLVERVVQAPYIRYRFDPLIYLMFAALAAAAAILVPQIVYRVMDRRENFQERIRSCRE